MAIQTLQDDAYYEQRSKINANFAEVGARPNARVWA